MKRARLLIGIVLVIIAVWMLVFSGDDYAMAGIMAIGITGLISIATSRRG